MDLIVNKAVARSVLHIMLVIVFHSDRPCKHTVASELNGACRGDATACEFPSAVFTLWLPTL